MEQDNLSLTPPALRDIANKNINQLLQEKSRKYNLQIYATKHTWLYSSAKNFFFGKVKFDDLENAKDRQIHILGYDPNNKGPTIGARHVQIGLICLGMTVGFAMRTNLSVAIVAMTDNKTSSNHDIPTYDWHNTSVILSSFFWGYICLQVLAGYLAKTYGPKYFLLVTFLINSIAFMLIPLAAAQMGSIGVMICRIVQGLTQGFLFPSAHTILGRWSPAEERSTMGIIIYSGIGCGSVLSSIITGFLASSSIGWPSSFYIFGSCGVVWCVIFLIFGQNSPLTHPTITKEERRYIQVSLGQGETVEFVPVPWKSILTCIHFYAIIIANIGNSWGYAMLMTEVPTYLAKVMEFDMKSNGLVSAIPYMVGILAGFVIAPIADYLVTNRYVTRVTSRRCAQLFGANGQMICLLLLAFVAKTKVSSIVLLALGNVANSATLVGYSVNHVDLSPRFSGIMQGISNATSQAIAIFSPLLVQFVVTDPADPAQWRIIFIVAAAMYIVCAVFYATFASSTRQEWDGPKTEAVDKMERIKKASVISVSGY